MESSNPHEKYGQPWGYARVKLDVEVAVRVRTYPVTGGAEWGNDRGYLSRVVKLSFDEEFTSEDKLREAFARVEATLLEAARRPSEVEGTVVAPDG